MGRPATRFATILALLVLPAATGCGPYRQRGSIVDASEDFPTSDRFVYSVGFDDGGSDAAAPPEDGGPVAFVPPQPIAFGFVGCGAGPSTQTFPVFNAGLSPLDVSALVTGAQFSVSPGSLTIAPGDTGMFNVQAIVPASAPAGTSLGGAMLLTTNDPALPMANVPLSVVPAGATIGLLYPGASSFPTSEVAETVVREVDVVNSGNSLATITVGDFSDSHFALRNPPDGGSVQLGAKEVWKASVSFRASDTSPTTATLPITVSGGTCGASATSFTFTGEGSLGSLTGWPTAPVDFGPSLCGGGPPAPQTFSLTNSSAVDVLVEGIRIDPPTFTTTSVRSGDRIAASGGWLDITVFAPPVPSPSPMTPITATLTILTDAEPSPRQITLQEQPQGAILAFDTAGSPGFGSFGDVVLLSSATQTFAVTNSGTASADVSVAMASASGGGGSDAGASPDAGPDGQAPAPSVFGVATPAFSLAPGQRQDNAVRFVPATGGTAVDAVVLNATGPICSVLPAPLPVSGIGLGGGLSISPSQLAFAPTCGGPAPLDQTITLVNVGPADLHWTLGPVTGPGAAQYTVSPLQPPGLLAPSQRATLRVSAAAIPSPAPNPDPAALAAQLVITTDAPLDAPHVVPLGETPLGDRLSLSVQSLRYGQYPIDHIAPPQTFTVSNTANRGSRAATVEVVLSSDNGGAVYVQPMDGGLVCLVPPDGGADAAPYCTVPEAGPSIDGGGDGTVEGGDEGGGPEYVVDGYLLTPSSPFGLDPAATSPPQTVTFIPTAPVAYPARLSLRTSDPLCSALPDPIQLTGTGTQGQVSISSAALAFGTDPNDPLGLVNCGATGLPRTVHVTNGGNQPVSITGLTLGHGAQSPYTLSGAGAALPHVVPLGGSADITITPRGIPAAVPDPNDASLFADTLTITTDAMFDAPHRVALVMQPRGAVITGAPVSLAWSFGTVTLGSIGHFVIGIKNTGNAPASVALQGLARPTVFGLENNPTTVPPNAFGALVGQFAPPSPGQTFGDSGTLAVSAEAFCQPLPAPWSNPVVTLSGAASSDPPVIASGSLAFPSSDCGNAPPAAQAVTLTNKTNQPYGYTVAFANGSFYSITDPGPGTIAGASSATILVSPRTVTPGPGVQAGAAPYADSLVVSTFPAGAGDAASSPAAPGFTIPISWTLNGAVLALPLGAGPDRDASGNSFYVTDAVNGYALPMANSGTKAAAVAFAVQPAGALTSGPAGASTVPAAGSVATQLWATPSDVSCPGNTPATLTFIYSGPVCQPFAAPSVTVRACSGSL